MSERSTGLTLLELLLALALMAILLAGLLSVLRTLSPERDLHDKTPLAPAWAGRIESLLSRDLASASAIASGPGRLRLLTHRSLDASHPALVLVDYHLVRKNLLRSERRADSLSTEPDRRDLVLLGIASIRFGAPEDDGDRGVDPRALLRRLEASNSEAPSTESASQELRAPPDVLRIEIAYEAESGGPGGRLVVEARRG